MAVVPTILALSGICIALLYAWVQHLRLGDVEREQNVTTDWYRTELEHLSREVALLRARVAVHASVIGNPSWRESSLNAIPVGVATDVSPANMRPQQQ
jgi:hypothetical protein